MGFEHKAHVRELMKRLQYAGPFGFCFDILLGLKMVYQPGTVNRVESRKSDGRANEIVSSYRVNGTSTAEDGRLICYCARTELSAVGGFTCIFQSATLICRNFFSSNSHD